MDLILWRHADAEPGEPDDQRRLTAKGKKQARRAGRGCTALEKTSARHCWQMAHGTSLSMGA